MTSCTVTCVLLSVSGPEGENQNTFCIINLQIFLANSTQILYTKDRDHTTGGKVGIPTGSMVNAADRKEPPGGLFIIIKKERMQCRCYHWKKN